MASLWSFSSLLRQTSYSSSFPHRLPVHSPRRTWLGFVASGFVCVQLFQHVRELALQNFIVRYQLGIPSAGNNAFDVVGDAVPIGNKGATAFELIQDGQCL